MEQRYDAVTMVMRDGFTVSVVLVLSNIVFAIEQMFLNERTSTFALIVVIASRAQ
jgi:hypothetical protein